MNDALLCQNFIQTSFMSSKSFFCCGATILMSKRALEDEDKYTSSLVKIEVCTNVSCCVSAFNDQ